MKFKWELTGSDPNDLKCNVGEEDMLRVERMDKGVWWWAVYIGKDTYMANELFPCVGTKEVAKAMCESVYMLVKKLKP